MPDMDGFGKAGAELHLCLTIQGDEDSLWCDRAVASLCIQLPGCAFGALSFDWTQPGQSSVLTPEGQEVSCGAWSLFLAFNNLTFWGK